MTQDRLVDVGEVALRVVEDGSGPAVLFLHGFPDTGDLWRHQAAALAPAGFRTIAPDLRGMGGSDAPQDPSAYSIRRMLTDIVGLLDALDVEQAQVVGHDFGALLGWAVAGYLPERVRRFVACSVGHPSAFWSAGGIRQRQRSWYMWFFRQEGLAEEALRQDDWALARELLAAHPDLDRILEHLARPGRLTAALNWYRGMQSPKGLVFGPPDFPRVTCPVLGVWSTEDPACLEAQMAASTQFVDDWRYERIDGAGHWLSLEAPDTLNALLLEFLERPRGVRR